MIGHINKQTEILFFLYTDTLYNKWIKCVGSLLLNAGYSILQLEAQGTLLQYGVDEYQNIMDLSDTYSDILIVGKQSWTNIST